MSNTTNDGFVDRLIGLSGKGLELPDEVIKTIKESVNSGGKSGNASVVTAKFVSETTGASVTPEDVVPMVKATGIPPELIALPEEKEVQPIVQSMKDMVPGCKYKKTEKGYELVSDGKEEHKPDFNVAEAPDGRGYTTKDIIETLESIEQVNASFEVHRKAIEAKEKLQAACITAGIGRKDQEYIDKKMRESNYTENDITVIIEDEKKLNATFFTREDGKVIKTKPIGGGYTDYSIKQEIVSFVYSFYIWEKGLSKEVDEVNAETSEIINGGVELMTDHIANTFLRSIEEGRKIAKSQPENVETDLALKRYDVLEKAFTLEDIKNFLRTIPKAVENTIWGYKHPTEIRRIGEMYGKQKQATETMSTLSSSITDDHSQSIEAKYLNHEQYVEGYENLFAFTLIRYYSRQKWKEKTTFVRDQHNAVCILLRALLDGSMTKEVRDAFLKNVIEVWSFFLPVLKGDADEKN